MHLPIIHFIGIRPAVTNHNIHNNVVWDGEICVYIMFNLEGPLYCVHCICFYLHKPVNDTVALTNVYLANLKYVVLGSIVDYRRD